RSRSDSPRRRSTSRSSSSRSPFAMSRICRLLGTLPIAAHSRSRERNYTSLKCRSAPGVLLLHAAAAGRRQHFIGAEVAAGIKCVAKIFHRGQIGRSEHFAHKADFFDADAVLARYASAARQTFLQDLVAGSEHALDLGRVALVEQQNRMNVAVAGMEDIDDPNVVLAADLHDFSQDMRQFGAGDNAVLRAVAG